MIRGYPGRPSVAPGQPLTLHVSTNAPRFRVAFHRWGDGFQAMQASGWLPGVDAPAGTPDADWQWPPYLFDIPRDWPSGVYVAHLQEPEPAPLAVAMEHAAALFVVRGHGRSRLLYKLPFATFQAYNCTGGGCFYFRPPRSGDPQRPGAKLTWRRPGGGIGGETFGAPDYYDTASPRQTFAHWDAGFIRWLSRQGYDDVEYCADLDVHEDPALLARHRLLVSVGHDEYWTEALRDQVERFVSQGGNASFFAANLCWWRIHMVEGNSAMVCHQGGPEGALDHWWPESGAHRPEDSIAGVSYRHGGG
ncbi:MAG: N,N-dimethylformamidase beta subunit family domain-containing protein, partial [Gammaproteobacteria bacterium]